MNSFFLFLFNTFKKALYNKVYVQGLFLSSIQLVYRELEKYIQLISHWKDILILNRTVSLFSAAHLSVESKHL